MRIRVRGRIQEAAVVVALLAPALAAAQAQAYGAILAQAEADLHSGRAAQALAESEKAILTDPTRWEAYMVAGGAFEAQQQYPQAMQNFSAALERAPQSSKAAVQGLLELCLKRQMAAGPAQTPAIANSAAQFDSGAPAAPQTAFASSPPPAPQALAQGTSAQAASPTLPVTMKFIVDTVNDSSVDSMSFDEPGYDSNSIETFGASAPGGCTLAWTRMTTDYGGYGFGANVERLAYTVDLSKVDLSTISVSRTSNDAEAGFDVSLAALPGTFLGIQVRTYFNEQSGQAWFAHTNLKAIANARTADCPPRDKKCSVTQNDVPSAAIFLNDENVANRLSRALQHAAALCGAKSSQSPQSAPPF